tara:strand:- start:12326 stop:12616 length:291 start_codon:yes stop_codon:yes gene_type:complete
MFSYSDDTTTLGGIEFDMAMPSIFPGSTVDHPSHYNQGDVECIDAMLAAAGKDAVQNFCHLSCMKYLWRFQHKNGVEDLKKADWYLKKLIELNKLD